MEPVDQSGGGLLSQLYLVLGHYSVLLGQIVYRNVRQLQTAAQDHQRAYQDRSQGHQGQ